MKLFVILCALAVICLAAPIDDKVEVESSYNEISGNSYRFGYYLNDKQSRNEEGKLVQVGEKQVLQVTGSYSFVGDDGKKYKVNYVADEKGYQPMAGKPIPEIPTVKEEPLYFLPVSSIDPNLAKTLLFG